MIDIENLRDTIAPKSDQLNADDLVGSTKKIITVTNVKRTGSAQQPIAVEYEGAKGKPFKPCLTMRKILLALWTDDGHNWIGKSMKLYRDDSVVWAGEKTGGVRISHMSGITKQERIMLQVAKGKRKEFVIDVLPSYPDADFAEKSPQWIAAIKAEKITLEEVIQKASVTGVLTREQIEILKGAVNNGN